MRRRVTFSAIGRYKPAETYQKGHHTMRKALAILLILLIPVGANAGIDAGDLPEGSTWYLHIDIDQMRNSEAGRSIYSWLDKEINVEIDEETGIDIIDELDNLTAFSVNGDGFVLSLEGDFSQQTQDKLMALAAVAEDFEQRGSRNRTYYYVRGDNDGHIQFDGAEDAAYFSFAIDDRILVTASEEQMQELLANRGRIAGQGSHDDALFVLTAERAFLQAGMNPDEVEIDDDGFDSNIAQNTREVAVMIAEVAGKIAFEAQIVTTEAEIADSMASIVRGLIALQVFSDDMEPEVAELLRNTRVDVDGENLKISVAVSPDAIIAALDEA